MSLFVAVEFGNDKLSDLCLKKFYDFKWTKKLKKMYKLKVTNCLQFEKLVEELEKNPPLARGFRRSTTPNNFKEVWETISVKLNAFGPTRRTSEGWQKVWKDLKFKVKKKMVTNKAESRATGGGLNKMYSLTPLEETVANIMQFQKQLFPAGCVQGVQVETPQCSGTNSVPEDEVDSYFDEILENDDAIPVSTPSRIRKNTAAENKASGTSKKEMKHDLLKNHSKEQATLLKDISNSISSLKRASREIEKVQKRSLEILEDKNKREKEMHEADMKLIRLKIKIKEELQLLALKFN